MEIYLILEVILISSLLYAYLHKKTRISLKFLYLDNIGVIIPLIALVHLACYIHFYSSIIVLLIPLFSIGFAFTYTMIRFWRTPSRKIKATENELVSPADGNIIYIKKVDEGNVPISIKKARTFLLNELTKTDILVNPCWLIGINMTPFDVHKNCSPIKGKIILVKHFNGKFLSLKESDAQTENERNTFVISNDNLMIGIVQIASRLVKRIDTYVNDEQWVEKGQWIGMIRFGSQVDLIIPQDLELNIDVGQQVYAGISIIARK